VIAEPIPPAGLHLGNADPAELDRFARLAASWWDRNGPMRPLHDLNPVRLDFVARQRPLAGACALDVGCGGGLLSEALSRAGAAVVALDLAGPLLEVARLHAAEQRLPVRYLLEPVEAHAAAHVRAYDVVTCMEMLEHVPDPAAVVSACARALRPGGVLCVSTLNRTAKAFALAIVGAEYLLGLLPRGTHEYARFVRPSELHGWCRSAGLEVVDLAGLHYDPLRRRAWLGADVGVNYLLAARKPA
jgi:2-polyprenyl-6-hydroxyphenyl methylase/3-demethylubiquinone-9 3-methyltransferase